MVTIGKLYTSVEDYKKDSYYCNSPGEFFGGVAERMGLKGQEMTEEMYQNLKAGRDPTTKEQLVAPGPNGEHRAGWDACITPDKSLSVAWATGTPEQKQMIENKILKPSANYLLSYTEKNLIQARDSEGQAYRTGQMLAWTQVHYSNRQGEINLHVHCVICNLTRDPETEQFKAVHSDGLLKREHLISVYESALAHFTKEAGLAVENYKPEHGSGKSIYTRLSGVYQKLIDIASKRTHQIEEYFKTHEKELRGQYPGADKGALMKIATIETRQEKHELTQEQITEKYLQEIKEAGFDKNQIWESIQRFAEISKKESSLNPKLNEKEYVMIAAKSLSENEAVITKEDILTAANRLSNGQIFTEKIQNTVNELQKQKEIIHLETASIKGKGVVEYYTTQEMMKAEKDIKIDIEKGKGQDKAPYTKKQAGEVIQKINDKLMKDQQGAAGFVLSNSDNIIGIQGHAGTGKSTMFSATRQALEMQGYAVHGLAPTGKAAQGLEKSSGIKSETIDSFLLKNNSKEKISSEKNVFVVDEVSMLGSIKMNAMLEKIQNEYGKDSKIILCGDIMQCPPISAGIPFKNMIERGHINYAEMKEAVRFKTGQTRDISAAVIENDTGRVFERLKEDKAIKEITDRQERINAAAEKYLSIGDKNKAILALTRQDCKDLNDAVRAGLKEQKEISEKEYNFTIRENKNLQGIEKHLSHNYGVGDYIYFNKAGGERAGTQGIITEINHKDNTITFTREKDGEERKIELARHGDKINAYEHRKIQLSKGDKIVFMKNDGYRGVSNGTVAEIKRIDENGKVTFQTDSGKKTTFNLNEDYSYISHGYALTIHKGQGETYKHCISYFDSANQTANQQLFNVAMTRATHENSVFVDNINKVQEQARHEMEKTSTLDYDIQGHQRTEREVVQQGVQITM